MIKFKRYLYPKTLTIFIDFIATRSSSRCVTLFHYYNSYVSNTYTIHYILLFKRTLCIVIQENNISINLVIYMNNDDKGEGRKTMYHRSLLVFVLIFLPKLFNSYKIRKMFKLHQIMDFIFINATSRLLAREEEKKESR